MIGAVRGADILARALDGAGLRTVFTLSGNHVMPLFDAAIGTGLRLHHTRHEAAAVHMADAWARLTGRCGIALVTGGPGHANAMGALMTARAAEAPLVLLSGHAALSELGRGAFQELRQAEMAAPVTKASWTARSAATLGGDLAEAVRIARSGRPGPVHLSLPVDLLDEVVPDGSAALPPASRFEPRPRGLAGADVRAIRAAIAAAARPLILAGPALCHDGMATHLARLATATGAPVIGMESPRGINDPRLGAFAEVLARADLLVLLGKPHDFTLRFAEPPLVAADCRFAAIDPDPALLDRIGREKGDRLVVRAEADPVPAAHGLADRGSCGDHEPWRVEVEAAIAYRPADWERASSGSGKVHPAELCRAVADTLATLLDPVLICDGGEIGQWGQTIRQPGRRVVNGVAGSIGAGIPFAFAARAATGSPVVAIMGDGAFGFHVAEFDTALRCGLPAVVVVGNDAAWNAEHQIQLRTYGAERAHGCELLPTRYDRVVKALGGHGEHVEQAAELKPALTRALESGKPACVNVMIDRLPAPLIRRGS